MSRTYCWFDITFGGKAASERVIFELFDDITPKTCKNFRELCLGNGGKTVDGTSILMTYKGCSFHRIIKDFMNQGGDFTNHNGTGGVSIYGEKFEDENFDVPCDKPGLLAMANAGPGTNGSQFFITAVPCPHLTGRHVVFGKTVRGMNVVRKMNHVTTGANDKPIDPVVIADCGVLDALPPIVPAADGDTDPDYPEDAESPLNDSALIEAGDRIRQLGNNHFKNGDCLEAIAKYEKAARYLSGVNKTSANAAIVNEKLVACYSNTSMSYLKLSKWNDARYAAEKALSVDPTNAKALFRRGTAYLQSGDTDAAIADFKRCAELDPTNAECAAKLSEAVNLDKAQRAKVAAGYKKMFS